MSDTNSQQEEFIRKSAEEIAYATYPEQTVMDDPEVIDAMIPVAERITPFIDAESTRRERAAQERLLVELEDDDFFKQCYGCSCDALGIIQAKRQALGEEQ